jgi:hypothetical protein
MKYILIVLALIAIIARFLLTNFPEDTDSIFRKSPELAEPVKTDELPDPEIIYLFYKPLFM